MRAIVRAICLPCSRDIFLDWTLQQWRHTDTHTVFCPEGWVAEPDPVTIEGDDPEPSALPEREDRGSG
jgi:hypothetical protein